MKPLFAIVAILIGVAIGFSTTYQSTQSHTKDFSSVEPDRWRSIESLLKEKNPETIADFLKELKSTHDNMFLSYALVHDTGSEQKASTSHPRVILSSLDGRLMLAFNGDPKLKGYGSLEVATYLKGKEKFEFRDVIFTKEASKDDFAKLTESDIEEKTENHWISKTNPGLCMTCHSKNFSYDPKPLWETYPVWPGVYGGIDDALVGIRRFFQQVSTKEAEIFKQYQAVAKQHPRYSLLSPIVVDFRRGNESGSKYQRPNLLLNERIHFLMGRRAARQVYQTENLRSSRYAILALRFCDLNVDTLQASHELFGKTENIFKKTDLFEVDRMLTKQQYDERKRKMNQVIKEVFNSETKEDQYYLKNGDPYTGYERWCRGQDCATMRSTLALYILLRDFSIDLSDWYPLLNGGVVDAFDGAYDLYFARGFASVIAETDKIEDPELIKIFKFLDAEVRIPFNKYNQKNVCDPLKTAALEAFRSGK